MPRGGSHMSGHNKWSTIKHKKGKADAKRGKLFTKIIRELTHGRARGWRRPGRQPAPARRGARGQGGEHAERHHAEGDPAGHGRAARGGLRGDRLRGLRPGRRRGHAPGADRQPQPHHRGDPPPLRASTAATSASPAASAFLFKKQGYLIVPKSAGGEDDGDGGGPRSRRRGLLRRRSGALRDLHGTRGSARGQGGSGGEGPPGRAGQGRDGARHAGAARGQAGRADGPPDGSLRGSRRRAERLGQLRHRREASSRRAKPVGVLGLDPGTPVDRVGNSSSAIDAGAVVGGLGCLRPPRNAGRPHDARLPLGSARCAPRATATGQSWRSRRRSRRGF